MKITKNIKLSIGIVCFLVLGVFLILQHWADVNRIDELEKANQLLRENEKQTIVIQRVSQQMEEIAREQQKVSEKEREEAVKQAEIAYDQSVLANQMRAKAEAQEKNAQEARIMAEKSANEAVLSANEAKRQKLYAEERQSEAERLSQLSLAHSMATQAVNLFKSGNQELAELLSYGSWVISQRNGDSKYQRAIYEALSLTGSQQYSVQPHRAGVNAISRINVNELVTVGRYGEIVRWTDIEGQMTPHVIYANKRNDFRDVYVDRNGHIYALTRHHEVMKDGNMLSDSKDILPNFLSIKQKNKIKEISHSLPSYINAEQISVITQSPKGTWAIGMKDGAIYLADKNFTIKDRLYGHKSQINKVVFNNNMLYSCSFDCTVNLWNTEADVIEPLTICKLEGGRWINDFMILGRYMWISDGMGFLTRIVLDPDLLARNTHHSLKRDFTTDEWNAYVGKTIPYEKMR